MIDQPVLTFVIADDHQMYLDCVRAILQEQGFHVVGEASDGGEAVRLCQELHPDVAVLDISMPRVNGLDAARQIRDLRSGTKIIVLSVHSEVSYIRESLRLGVQAYVTKSKAASRLLEAVDAVCCGETFVSVGGDNSLPRSLR